MGPDDKPCLLVADDDADDRLLIEEAIVDAELDLTLHFVEDGEQLMSFLLRRGVHAAAPRPSLVLLDLNMPRMDGREALRAIRADPTLRSLPIVVLSTSAADEDVSESYLLGANAFVCKPTRFDGLIDLVRTLDAWWFNCVQLPDPGP